MHLSFGRSGLDRLIEHTRKAPNHLPSFRQRKPIAPALWLVGGDGVYLMSNGSPGLRDDGKNFVVYARECDPTRMEFDDWWAAKRSSFGGDNSVERIELADIERTLLSYPDQRPLVFDVTPDAISIIGYGPPPKGAVAI